MVDGEVGAVIGADPEAVDRRTLRVALDLLLIYSGLTSTTY